MLRTAASARISGQMNGSACQVLPPAAKSKLGKDWHKVEIAHETERLLQIRNGNGPNAIRAIASGWVPGTAGLDR